MKNEASTRARGALAFWTDQLRKLNLSEEMELLRGASLLEEPDLDEGGDLSAPDVEAAAGADELMEAMKAEISEDLMAEALAGDSDDSDDSEDGDSEDGDSEDGDSKDGDSEKEDSEEGKEGEDAEEEDDEDEADELEEEEEIDETNVPMQDEDEFFGHVDDPVSDFPPTDEKD